ncbi:HAMP domain-containing protein [Myxococcota bacterium]
MFVAAIRRSLSLKLALTLAAITVVLTSGVALVITWRQSEAMQEITLNKARLSAELGAQAYGRALEDAVDNGYVTVNDVFDQNYLEIPGYDWGGQPKYHTKYDFYTDRVVVGLQDRFLVTPDFVSAVGTDVNGYLPTHNTKYQKPLTGDPARDLEGNRTKRIFNDEVGIKAARNQETILVQPYRRDTGAQLWDVSSPVFVKGKHWGCFRVLVSVDEIAKKRSALVWALVAMFGAFAIISAAVMFLLVRGSIRPLVQLTTLADDLSLGEGLDKPIKPTTVDEVGRMAKALDRLRASLKAAMSRLGE